MARTKDLDARAKALLEELAADAHIFADKAPEEIAFVQRSTIKAALHRAIQADRRARRAR